MVQLSAQITFNYLSGTFNFPNRNRLKDFIIKLFKKEGFKTGTINYIFCTDEYLLQINQQYLNHNTYTDIITFPLSEKNEPISSDIFISTDRIKENAKTFNTSFQNELHRVIFHGILHLCGYKDKTKEQSALMRQKEQHYLDLYFK
ncbi:MAG TPA: rRNA maturation RNase YbeY [Flavisolibacter sp.]|nr:rRNA maturation RNase YbeY [Flavisolibacter sp.]